MWWLIAFVLVIVVPLVSWNYFHNVRPEQLKAKAARLKHLAGSLDGIAYICLELLAQKANHGPLPLNSFVAKLEGVHNPRRLALTSLDVLRKGDCIRETRKGYRITEFGKLVFAATRTHYAGTAKTPGSPK